MYGIHFSHATLLQYHDQAEFPFVTSLATLLHLEVNFIRYVNG